MPKPNIVHLEHTSEKLKNNLWGDPHVRNLPVYLPPGYDAQRPTPYPVIYFLNGYSGKGEGLLHSNSVFYQPLPERLDAMILSGESPAFIAVLPDGSTRLGASQYVNSIVNGPYMDYLCDEIVPFIDDQFHTRRGPAFRAISGHSSGGFGALVTGMLRPDVFSHLLSSSGDSFYEALYLGAIPMALTTLREAGGVESFMDRFFSSPNPDRMLPSTYHTTMMILCMCTCYAPNPRVPHLKADLYFDLQTGKVMPEVWDKFMAWDPVRMVRPYEKALRSMQSIRLDAGLQDEYGLQWGHRQIRDELTSLGIEVELQEYEGKHGGQGHRFAERFMWLAKRILKNF